MQKTVNIVYLHCNHKYCFIAVRGELSQVPQNVATKVRNKVTLPCAGDSNKQWDVVALDSINSILTITYGKEIVDDLKDRFSLNTDGGQFSLVIKSPVLSDGTTYRCKEVINAQEQHGVAEVIVFGKTYTCIFIFFTDQSLTFLRGKYSDFLFSHKIMLNTVYKRLYNVNYLHCNLNVC